MPSLSSWEEEEFGQICSGTRSSASPSPHPQPLFPVTGGPGSSHQVMSPCPGCRLVSRKQRDALGLQGGVSSLVTHAGSTMRKGPLDHLGRYWASPDRSLSMLAPESQSEGSLLSQLEATVLTQSHFLFTPQEARRTKVPPPPPQEDTAGRTPHAAAGHPGPAVGPHTTPLSEGQPGRRAASPGRSSSARRRDLLGQGPALGEDCLER